jgi:hypothetical protein
MSLLQSNPRNPADHVSQGEDLASGTSPLLWAAIAALVLVSAAIGIFFLTNRERKLAHGEITESWVHPVHVLTPAYDANGDAIPQQEFDQVLVFSHVRLKNVSDKPLYLTRVLVNATLDDGLHTSYAASNSDYEKIFLIYPALKAFKRQGLPLDATMEPGQTIEGEFAASFKVAKAAWDARKDLNFTFQFRYQPDLALTLQSAVVER